jgi:glycine/D-amino acid oxidase-like deaminating enzyme
LVDQINKQNLTHLHQAIIPREGYLVAYVEERVESYATAFFTNEKLYADVPYWYLSRALYHQKSLMLIGGPEFILPTPCPPDFSKQNAETSLVLFKKFLKQTYNITPEFDFFWHGLMGYTPTGLRWVGKDPHYPTLWYNLGCNGIGIVPAIAGANRLAKLLNGDRLAPSLFDPPVN